MRLTMKTIAQRPSSMPYFVMCVSIAAAAAAQSAFAQNVDRERAQLLQMQQQLQRLEADNAALKEQAKDAETFKKQSAQTSKELARTRAEAVAAARDIELLHAAIDTLREQTSAQIEQWKKAVEERDAALQTAATEKRKLEGEVSMLSSRLKTQTGRADLCEVKHEQAMNFGKEVVDEYEAKRLRLCEPVTGIWRVREEEHIQSLRDRLYGLRLDVPVAQSADPERASASTLQASDPRTH